MKKFSVMSLGVLLAAASVSASAFNFNDAAKLASQFGGTEAASTQSGGAGALELVSALSSLNVTPQQAVGGTGALLSVAQNQLPANQYSSLLGAVPGLENFAGSNGLNQLSGLTDLAGAFGLQSKEAPVSSGAMSLLNNVKTMNDANQAFSALGMDSGLISQFAPLLLQYLGNQGAGGSLLQNLAGVWGVAGR